MVKEERLAYWTRLFESLGLEESERKAKAISELVDFHEKEMALRALEDLGNGG